MISYLPYLSETYDHATLLVSYRNINFS